MYYWQLKKYKGWQKSNHWRETHSYEKRWDVMKMQGPTKRIMVECGQMGYTKYLLYLEFGWEEMS